MELNYVDSCSNIRPPELEFQVTTVYLRKDFVEDGSLWRYKECALSYPEFNEHIQQQTLENNQNQLIIMEAIADLYDRISQIESGV